MDLLRVSNLKMHFRVGAGWVRAVDDVSFELGPSENLGLVGESGCGKTSIGYSLIRLLPPNGRIKGGQILLDGDDVVTLPEPRLRRVRWKKVAMVFQNSMSAFNPVFRIGDQIVDALREHEDASLERARARAGEIFELVGLSKARLNDYPHEFSGGMKQRAIIAMALICNPKLLIADEPTTALDVIAQDQVLQQIRELQEQLRIATIIISHDVSVIAETCQKVAVMYGGQIVEYGPIRDIFRESRHPYTKALLRSFPSIRGPINSLASIPGAPPDLLNPPPGCRFAPRCEVARRECLVETPPMIAVTPQHQFRCSFGL